MAYGDPPICTCNMGMTTHIGAIGPCPTHGGRIDDPDADPFDDTDGTTDPPRRRGTRSNMSPFAALAMMSALASGVPPMPGERDPFRVPTKAPKPPDDIQAAIKAKAEARRERVRARNLKNLEQR